MKNIHTVLGPLPVDQMGLTLAHEHICCGDWSMRANFGPRFCPEEELLARAVDQRHVMGLVIDQEGFRVETAAEMLQD